MANPDSLLQFLRPEFTDLGAVSTSLRSTWGAVRMQHAHANEYYSGAIFEKRIEVENGDPTTAPLMYPVAVNVIKMLVLAMTDAFLGEHEENDSPVLFTPAASEDSSEKLKKISNFCYQVLRDSSGGTMLWEQEFDRNLYGASVMKVMPVLANKSHLRWARIPVDNFFPVFDPEDPDTLLEAYVATYLYGEQARGKYGYVGNSDDLVMRVEHWTPEKYTTKLNEQTINAYSGVNPFGVVPFVFTPRMRTLDPFGESLIGDLYSVQDELNARLADAGDALNYNMHPIRTGVNLPSAFNSKNYPLGPDCMWDMGRSMNPDMKPEIAVHQIKEPVPEALFKYVNFLYDWSRTSVFAPPIAFGEDNGGGQRSGTTLEIRLWPLLKAMRRSRSYAASSIMRAMKLSAKILDQKKFGDIPQYIIDGMNYGEVVPQFHRVLPRDQKAAVDEVVQLMSTRPSPSISLETAQSVLGRGAGELPRIMNMLDDMEAKGYWPDKVQAQPEGTSTPGGSPAKTGKGD